ncbi:Sip3 protein [Saccharomycopsis crataegensis]|uniref:Sip3 protein n=1 Tax=Saccharomycopsis crataegensis TaxID=43959 RepID=A0AAV5QFJ5_9ASCO|nr:Sip3 protein [Saccharomycopsis crataegensis]
MSSHEKAPDQSALNQSMGSPPMSPYPEQPRLLKLISVAFKEAALDSPTFRANVNHLNHLIEQCEQWIDGLLKFIKKFPQYYNDFKDFLHISVDQLSPGFLNDGIIDQDYTLSALTFTKKGLSTLWSDSLKLFRVNDSELVLLLTQAKNDIKTYKEYRKSFEVSQSKYDLYLSRYSAQSKTKEPSALREDAFQLSEVRKSYIHISLELCIALSNIQKSLDSTLVSVASNFWKDIDMSMAASNPYNLYLYNQLEKIKSWAKACDFSLRILSKDMLTARKQIEESAIQQFTPSRDLNDHNPILINPGTLLDLKEPVYEKHGWLFMKTSVGKPARQIWVRRWAFVKNGMFGLLNLSPSKTFVQETDKIGVLLCNVRYSPNEDRRFCFEIKTIDTTIILQAETLNELKYWLKVFATEKKRSIEQVDKKKKESSAFARYPPLLSEFASTATTTCDFEMTSGKVENTNNGNNAFNNGSTNNIITSNNLSKLMNSFNKSSNPEFTDYVPENSTDVQFSKDGVFQEPVLNTPISTRLTKAAIISNTFLSPSSIPNAINANIWGTVNWGMYYLVSSEARAKGNNDSSSQRLLVSQLDVDSVDKFAGKVYPSFYPKNMINYDIQMRAIFETALQKNERCLLSFRCIWSPNSKQELSGRCFVTMDNIYFYMNSMGFVSLLMKDLNDLVSVETHYKKNWDILKVYAIDGLNMRAKIFLDDAKLIEKKLEVLINNKTAVKPLGFKELVGKMEALEAEREIEDSGKTINNETVNPSPNGIALKEPGILMNNDDPNSKATTDKEVVVPSLYSIKNVADVKTFKNDYSNEYDRLLCAAEINLPAKALFHVLFGDNSKIFKEVFTLIVSNQSDGYVQLPWKITKENNKLQRKLLFKLSTNSKNSLLKDKILIDSTYNGIVLGQMSEVQTIDELVDNQYYNINTQRSSLELPLGAPFESRGRIIIQAIDSENCKLKIYSKFLFSRLSPSNYLISNIYGSLFKDEARKIVVKIQKSVAQIGTYGKTNKTIKLYGQLGTKIHHDNDEDKEKYLNEDYSIADEDNIKFGFLLFSKIFLKVTTIRIFNFLYLVSSFIFRGINKFFMSLSMNKFLILLLMISSIFNVYLSGKAGVSYWISKSTEKMINDYTKMASNNINNHQNGKLNGYSNHNGGFMQRAIYLKDIEEMIEKGKELSINSSSKCFKEFKNDSFVLNFEKSSLQKHFLRKQYGNIASLQAAQKLQNTLQEIGVRRNELLIDLKVLEKVEKEIAIGEWKNWLLNENHQCDFVKEEIIAKVLDSQENSGKISEAVIFGGDNRLDIDGILPGASELLSYCDSCKAELANSYLL